MPPAPQQIEASGEQLPTISESGADHRQFIGTENHPTHNAVAAFASAGAGATRHLLPDRLTFTLLGGGVSDHPLVSQA
jgi:hypothetical protein